jgi:hypothetical protein
MDSSQKKIWVDTLSDGMVPISSISYFSKEMDKKQLKNWKTVSEFDGKLVTLNILAKEENPEVK